MMNSDQLRKLYMDALQNIGGPLEEAIDGLCGMHTGFALFIFAFSPDGERVPGALSYMSNAARPDMIETVREWLAFQDAGITSGPPGPVGQG